MKKSISATYLISRIKLLLKPQKKRAFVASLVLIFQGITEGVGLLFILPLLSLTGIEKLDQSTSGISSTIYNIFQSLQLPLTLPVILVIYLFIICFYSALKYFQSLNAAVINQKITSAWRFNLFESITNTAWGVVQQFKTGELQELIAFETRKLGSISNQFIQFLSAAVITLIYLVISLLISVKLTLLAIVPLGILLLISRPLNKKSTTTGKSMISFNQSLYEIIEEHLAAIRLVKIFNKEASQKEQFEGISDELEANQLRFIKTGNRTKIIFEIVAAAAIAFYVYFALSRNLLPIAELLLLLFTFARLLQKVGKLVNNYQTILNTIPAFDSVINCIEKLVPVTRNATDNFEKPSFQNDISFNKVDFRYGTNQVLNEISFSIPFNKTSAIIGKSGAGKSTLIDLLLGLHFPLKGAILVDNINLKSIDLTDWRNAIGYVPQDPFLFNGSIKDNLLWAKPNATEEEVWSALETASAKNFVKQLPESLATRTGNRGTQLSGGERQRIALARALLLQPKVLILDEATSAVDNANEQLIKVALEKLHTKMTIIIVAHRSELIGLADHTIQV